MIKLTGLEINLPMYVDENYIIGIERLPEETDIVYGSIQERTLLRMAPGYPDERLLVREMPETVYELMEKARD